MSPRQFLATCCIAALTLAGCGGSNPPAGSEAGGSIGAAASSVDGAAKRIIILSNGDDPFWDACEAGCKAAEEELKLKDDGYVVDFQRGGFSIQKQVELLKGYRLAGDVVGVGVSVYDSASNAIAREMEDLQKAGIAVVAIDGDVDRERFRDVRKAYLGTDNIIAGRKLGLAAQALSPDGGNYVCFVGNKSAANAIARISGFGEGAGENFKELEVLADDTKKAKARQFVNDAIQRHNDLDTLVGIWAYNAPAIVQIVDEKQRRDDFKIFSIDAAVLTIRAMAEGKVDAMVVQNPFAMGFEGTKLVHALVTGDDATFKKMFPNYGEKDGDIFSTGLKVVVPEGSPLVEQKEAFEGDNTEFMTLPPFQDWLAERGLTSS